MLNVDWLIFLRIIGENNGLSMRTFEINSQMQNIDLDMRIFEKQYPFHNDVIWPGSLALMNRQSPCVIY
jgi:hypothetical protein